MVAIVTKYHGPTNTRGSRVSASGNGHRVEVAHESALDSEANHRRAVRALCDKLGWDEDRFYGGSMDDGRWAWVPVFPYDWEQRQKETTNATS
jgi:hypothetical protein